MDPTAKHGVKLERLREKQAHLEEELRIRELQARLRCWLGLTVQHNFCILVIFDENKIVCLLRHFLTYPFALVSPGRTQGRAREGEIRSVLKDIAAKQAKLARKVKPLRKFLQCSVPKKVRLSLFSPGCLASPWGKVRRCCC